MRQKVLSKAFYSLQRRKQGWQPSFEEDTTPAVSDMPWHEGTFYQQGYLKRGRYLTISVLRWDLEELSGAQMSLWSNGRWEKQDRGILQGDAEWGQALPRLISCHQLWPRTGQWLWVTPKGGNSYQDNSSGTALSSSAKTEQTVPMWLGYISVALLAQFPTDSRGSGSGLQTRVKTTLWWTPGLAVVARGFHNSQGKYLK